MEKYINALFNNITLKKCLILKEFDIFVARMHLNAWLIAFVPLAFNNPEKAFLKDLNWFHLEHRIHIQKIFGEKSIPYHTFPVQQLHIPDGFPLIDFHTVERTSDGIKYKNPQFPDFEIFLFNDTRRKADKVQYPRSVNLVKAVLTLWFSCTQLNKTISSSNIVVL